MRDTESQPEPLSPKDFHILFALAVRPKHGYAVVRDVEQRTGGSVRLEPANLYRRLHRFVEYGLIEQVAAPDGDDDGRRKYYDLTPRGVRTVEAEVRRMRALVRDARAQGLAPGESS